MSRARPATCLPATSPRASPTCCRTPTERFSARAPDNRAKRGASMKTLSIANGELWLHAPATARSQIESPCARELIERDLQSRRTTGWKNAPREQQSGMIPSSSLWGQGANRDGALPTRFLHACRAGDDATLYYVIAVGETRGLFRRHLDED